MTIHQECANARESALRDTIADLQRENEELHIAVNVARDLIKTLQRENAVLREQIDDWENAVLHARDNRSQEAHCTCVPPLLGKVQQLERDNAALRAALDAARKEQP
jgi:outer membrane murein-binding lipoprotein Lpp